MPVKTMTAMNAIALFAQQNSVAAPHNWALAWLIALGLLFLLVAFSYGTRAGIIARATTKEAIRQPLFFLLFFLAVAVLVLNTWMPFFTFKDDIKVLKNCGVSTLLICGMLLAIWTAGSSITNEIDGKTAMTLLSKPINRRQFIVGKYIGIVQAVLWLLVPLFVALSFLIAYKVGYDQREGSAEVTPWFQYHEVAGGSEIPFLHSERISGISEVLPGVVLAFFQIAVLSAIAVAIATRLPMVVNLVTCFAVFVIGNLTPKLVAQSEQVIESEPVIFVARLIATVLPSLESFDLSAAIDVGNRVPPSYLGIALLYGMAYITAAILAAFILFEDRDLA